MLTRHRHVLKTNFYQPTKVALSFRLAPDFLPEVEYPKQPFGMFIVIGACAAFRVPRALTRAQGTSSAGSTSASATSRAGASAS